MPDQTPSERQREIAREILNYTLSKPNGEQWEPGDRWMEKVAEIIARHDRPATATAICWLAKHADGKTSFHTTAKLAEATRRERGGTVIPLYAAPPAEGREAELRRILDDIRVAARVENRAFRLKSIDDLVAAALTPKGPTP